jgi:MoaA/NifB/PqqE/SkfB family radical SAM enzyme
VSGWGDRARLVRFFAALAVKEHLLPRLNVKPLVAELFLTDNCNLKCVSCACWRTVTRDELDTAQWRKVIDELAAAGVLKLNFTGGEPLLRRDAPELMAYAVSRGITNLHLNTNAVLLDERRRTAVLDAGVRSFNISIDGPDAGTHEAVRGVRGSFDRTLRHLDALLARREELDLRVRIMFTVMRRNLDTLPEMMRTAQRLRVPLYLNLATDTTFLFRDPQVSAEARLERADVDRVLAEVEAILRHDRRFLPRPSELSYLRAHFTERVQRRLPCAESQLKLMVHSRGEMGGCWGHDPTADARETSVRTLLRSRDYRDEHAKFFRKECVGCGSNYALNLRWRPNSYLRDASWRLGRRDLAGLSALT